MRPHSMLRPLTALLVLIAAACTDAPTEAAPETADSLAAAADEPSRDCELSETAAMVARAGDRVLGAGPFRWTLFDTATGQAIASGPIPKGSWADERPRTAGALQLAGSLAIVPTISERAGVVADQGIFLIDARDGRLQTHISNERALNRVGLASDASYVWAQRDRVVTLWRPDGTVITTVSDVSPSARVFAAPSALRMLIGAEEWVVDVSTRTVRVLTGQLPAPSGERSWFEDGGHFLELIASGTKARVYTAEHQFVQELGPLPPNQDLHFTGGNGAFFWTTGYSRTSVYRLDAVHPGAPLPAPLVELLHSKAPLIGGGGLLINVSGTPQYRVMTLRGAEPTVRAIDFGGPKTDQSSSPTAFSMDAQGNWAAVKNSQIFISGDGPTDALRRLGCERRPPSTPQITER